MWTQKQSPQIIGLTEVETENLAELKELLRESAACRTRFASIRARKNGDGKLYSQMSRTVEFVPVHQSNLS